MIKQRDFKGIHVRNHTKLLMVAFLNEFAFNLAQHQGLF